MNILTRAKRHELEISYDPGGDELNARLHPSGEPTASSFDVHRTDGLVLAFDAAQPGQLVSIQVRGLATVWPNEEAEALWALLGDELRRVVDPLVTELASDRPDAIDVSAPTRDRWATFHRQLRIAHGLPVAPQDPASSVLATLVGLGRTWAAGAARPAPRAASPADAESPADTQPSDALADLGLVAVDVTLSLQTEVGARTLVVVLLPNDDSTDRQWAVGVEGSDPVLAGPSERHLPPVVSAVIELPEGLSEEEVQALTVTVRTVTA